MSIATIMMIGQLVEMLISAANQLPSVISAGKTAVDLLKSNTDPTPEQEATIRTALDESHRLLQGSGA